MSVAPIVQIREEGKGFRPIHLAEVLNISASTVRRWTVTGRLPAPSSYNGRYSREDIERVFDIQGCVPIPKLTRKKRAEWQDTMKSNLILQENGVFLISPSAATGAQGMHGMITKYGLWDAQGLNNHVHLEDYIANPILQLVLAKELVNSWVAKAKTLPLSEKKIVIYWNGSVGSTVCIYLMLKEDEGYLREFDRRLGIKSLVTYEK